VTTTEERVIHSSLQSQQSNVRPRDAPKCVHKAHTCLFVCCPFAR